MHVCMCMCVFTCVHMCMFYVCLYACKCAYMCMCVRVFVRACVRACLHVKDIYNVVFTCSSNMTVLYVNSTITQTVDTVSLNCRQGWDSDLINICHLMYCYMPLEDGCYGGSPGAADGTTCAPNKVCVSQMSLSQSNQSASQSM